jgi:serine/threonine protein kinase
MSNRYAILGSIAKGGMAEVYLGRMVGSAGFSRLVAIKRLHGELAVQEQFVAMLLDEARLTAHIRHANVVDTLDLVASDGAFSVVMEYVEGNSLSALIKRSHDDNEPIPQPIAISIIYGMLRGLDAAHEARDEEGQPLGIVHRDVSPQNVLVGIDGVPRIIDFGVAKALGRLYATGPGEVRGKFSYMAPEQMLAHAVTRQVDVYSAGVLLWELLAGKTLFDSDDSRTVVAAVLRGDIPPPSSVNPDVPPELDAIVARATALDLGTRYLTAREFLAELEPWRTAADDEVGAWVKALCAELLAQRQRMIQQTSTVAAARPIDELMKDLEPPHSVRAELPTGSAGGVEVGQVPLHAAFPQLRTLYIPALALSALLVLVAILFHARGRSNDTEIDVPTADAVNELPPPPPAVQPPPAAEPVDAAPTETVIELDASSPAEPSSKPSVNAAHSARRPPPAAPPPPAPINRRNYR